MNKRSDQTRKIRVKQTIQIKQTNIRKGNWLMGVILKLG